MTWYWRSTIGCSLSTVGVRVCATNRCFSPLGRPLNQIAYANSDIIEFAAKYTAGIVRNHPFVDGNKRAGFVIGVLFLKLNGYRFTASEEGAAQAVLELPRGRLTKEVSLSSCGPIRNEANSRQRRREAGVMWIQDLIEI